MSKNEPKRAKREPKGAKSEPKGIQKGAEGSQKGVPGTPVVPLGDEMTSQGLTGVTGALKLVFT